MSLHARELSACIASCSSLQYQQPLPGQTPLAILLASTPVAAMGKTTTKPNVPKKGKMDKGGSRKAKPAATAAVARTKAKAKPAAQAVPPEGTLSKIPDVSMLPDPEAPPGFHLMVRCSNCDRSQVFVWKLYHLSKCVVCEQPWIQSIQDGGMMWRW